MRSLPTIRQRAFHRRRGLAPLELVMVLPLLMFTMALMVNFGTIASWKIRASTAARQSMWRARSTFDGAGDPKPENWFPQRATMSLNGAASLQSTDSVWNRPQINQPFVRGPVITEPTGVGLVHVNDERLYAMADGMRSGQAQLTRVMPLIPTLGNFSFNVQHPLFDSRWQFQHMGYGWNYDRRAKGWYNMENPPEIASLTADYRAADSNLQANPFHLELDALDRDLEFYNFYRNMPPNFHPGVGGCTADAQYVELNLIVGLPPHSALQGRISGRTARGRGGVPDQMVNAWIRLYQDQIRALQQQIDDIEAQIAALQAQIDALRMMDPVDAAAIARLEAEIARLRAGIPGLQAEIDRLQNIIDTQLIPFRNSLS